MTPYEQLDQWVQNHFDEQVKFLQALVRIPTDTPPGKNAPHAEQTALMLKDMGFSAEHHAVPSEVVKAAGLESITNLIVRQSFTPDGPQSNDALQLKSPWGITLAMNAHGDVVPPGEGWEHDPYGAQIEEGYLYGRASAVSKSDFSTFTFALRALKQLSESLANPNTKGSFAPPLGQVELHFTYDEEFGGELGPGWLLKHQLTKPNLMLAAGFSYEVVTAHNGCLQMEVTLQGKMAHAAIPQSGSDALQAAIHVLNDLYALNEDYKAINSEIAGIKHPYLNVGTIQGGTNTNVVPGRVSFKLDRRMIPEEHSNAVELSIREAIQKAVEHFNTLHPNQEPIKVEIKRILLAESMKPQAAQAPLIEGLQKHAQSVFGEIVPAVGTPLYTDVRLYAEHGVPGVIYGAGPRTVLESRAKRADERLLLSDLLKATKVVARTLYDLMSEPKLRK